MFILKELAVSCCYTES